MTNSSNSFASHFSGMQGQTRYNDEEIKQLRRRAWLEQGVLIVSYEDERLLPNQRRALMQIGHELYGKEGAA